MSEQVARLIGARTFPSVGRGSRPPSLRVFGKGTIFVVLSAIAASAIYPVVFILITALRSDEDYSRSSIGLPRSLTIDNFKDAWNRANLSTYAINSVIVVTVAVLLLTAVAALSGFAFAQLKVPFGRALLGSMVALMIVPPSVLMIPIFKLVSELDLLNRYTGLVLVYASLNLPFSIYLMTTYMRGIPFEIVDAARVDGASSFRTFISVALPLSRPGLATLATLNFLVLWNELLFALLLLQTDDKRTVMVGLSILTGQYLTSVPVIAAGLLFSMVPPLLIFALFQRDLVRGLTAGAVK